MTYVRSLPIVAAMLLMPGATLQASEITITPDQIAQLEVKLESARPATREAVAVLPATVIPALNARLAATAPFAGTVVQVHVLPGQQVAKGEPVATIASRELLDVQGLLAQSEAELQTAQVLADRKRTLADKKIMSASLAEEAEAQVAKVRAVIAQHKAAVSIGGIKLGEGGHYTICAPEAGRVAETAAMTGEPITAMAAAVTIDTRDEVWLEVQLPTTLVASVAAGDPVEVVDGPKGKVVSVARNIDKLTRSARLLAAVPANSGLLPGQMVNLKLLRTAEAGALQVPASAVAWINGEHAVFTRSAEGFTLKHVNLFSKTLQVATVSGNIAAGDEVAVSGLPQLETMLGGD